MIDFQCAGFTLLRSDSQAVWSRYTDHAFVQELGDGSLPEEAFLSYLQQDYLFLIHFARAWALAVVKSDKIEEMRACAATVHALIDEEMRLHIGICESHGITEADLAVLEEKAATLAYTRFVTDIGLRGDLLDLLTALLPCVFGYGEIGVTLASQKVTARPPAYQDWIETYSGQDYLGACDTVSTLYTRVAERLVGPDLSISPRWPELLKTFQIATQLEADFWSQGLNAIGEA